MNPITLLLLVFSFYQRKSTLILSQISAGGFLAFAALDAVYNIQQEKYLAAFSNPSMAIVRLCVPVRP